MSLGRTLAREAARDLRRDGEPLALEAEPAPAAPPDRGSLTWNAQAAAAAPPPARAESRGTVQGWRSDRIVGDAYQGEIEVRLSPLLLAELGWEAAPRRGMTILARGHRFAVQSCDTRALGGVAVLHIVQAKGGR